MNSDTPVRQRQKDEVNRGLSCRHIAISMGLLCFLALVAGIGQTARADFTANVKAVSSGKCLQVAGRATRSGARVEQWSCADAENQRIRFRDVAGASGVYTLNFLHSDKCVDVVGANSDNGTRVTQWTCHGFSNQRFVLDALGGGDYRLVAQHSDKVVDVKANSTQNGGDIHQWQWRDANNQKWQLVNVEGDGPGGGSSSSSSGGSGSSSGSSSSGGSSSGAVGNGPGKWSGVIDWPHIAVSAANLGDGRVITWSSNERDAFPGGVMFSHSAVFNPQNNNFQTTNNPGHDMFCAGVSLLGDGSVLASGGNPTLRETSLFDPTTLDWQPTDLMDKTRWYGTSVTLGNGDVFASFAKGAGSTSEVYSAGDGWRDTPGASMQTLNDEQNSINGGSDNGSTNAQWYAYMHVAPDGRVFHPGPTPTMHWFNPSGSGSVASAGKRLGEYRHRQFGSSVMYDVGKLLVTGGNDRRQSPSSSSTAFVIDINGASPSVSTAQAMRYPRVFHDAVVLPTGEVLVVGGNTSGVLFSDSGTVLTPELWNPDTGNWRSLADMSVPRNYHSVALLLKDGRVLAAGGGLCGNCSANHQNGQIYSPPYLFNDDGDPAPRPTINSAPGSVSVGGSFTISTSGSPTKFSMIRLSGTTHSINSDQRYLAVAASSNGAGSFDLSLNGNANVLIPGSYWLFAMNSAGTPSEGHLLTVSTSGGGGGSSSGGSGSSSGSSGGGSGGFAARVKSVNSGKCLDVSGGSVADGANVQQWSCGSQPNQQVNFKPVTGKPNVYTLSFTHSGQCLDVEASGTSNGTNMIQWPCNGASNALNQQFKLESLGGGEYRLTAEHSGKVVDVSGVSYDNGASVHQWKWVNGANQRWTLD